MIKAEKKILIFRFLLTSILWTPINAIQCWQCAAVDGRKCPQDATIVNSLAHDACITWRVGNGTVLLQNLVRLNEECSPSKVNFWSNFIDLYYRGSGGTVQCCSGDGCNTGISDDVRLSTVNQQQQNTNNDVFPGLPAELPGASLSSFLQQTAALTPPQQPTFVQQPSFQQIQQQQPLQGIGLQGAQDLNLAGFPQISPVAFQNGNCQQYFDKISAEEWLPRILVPLTFDRASETKIGVFYAKFKTYSSNNDHVVIRLIDSRKSNSTMYSIKLHRVGTVSIFISKLEADSFGELQRNEVRKQSRNNAVNVTDSEFNGFWFTIKNEELTLGLIGDRLIEPIILWNDTLREGPRDVAYFGLTTDQASATFGVNCDVPNLHFSDTCVVDEDCQDFPNTVCRNEPVNVGLDPGTRRTPFDEWEDRDTLLRSCFCKEGHLRIPESRGCYDPIRKVVTIRDACFAEYHCNDLPNTACVYDKDIPKYNSSCQCIKGNKPFEPNPRTGLIEGCAPLTDADKATILGCATKFKVEGRNEWVPDLQHPTEYDAGFGVDVGTVYVSLGRDGSSDDVAVVRLLDDVKSPQKMYTVKWYRRDGQISISESTRTRSFFFENESDRERATVDDLDILTRMQTGFVGFWIMYKYDNSVGGGQLAVGLNGAPFSPDYAIVKWTDTASSAIRSIKYMGFTASRNAEIEYGTNCVLLNTQIGLGVNPFVQINPQQTGFNQQTFALGQVQQQQQFSLNQVQPQLNQQGGFNLNQVQPQFSFQSFARNPSVSQSTTEPVRILQPNSGPVLRQEVPLGAKPWLLDPTSAMELELVTEPEETIIEPVLRNQYLTKLKRLLPTFFEGYSGGELESILLGKLPNEKEEETMESDIPAIPLQVVEDLPIYDIATE